jgi:alpha-1,3-rhamnosyl/mannosyltransferase
MSRIRIVFDASPLLVNRTGVAYYTERVATNLASRYPDELELVGFYYNFLGRHSTKHLPSAPNLRFHAIRFIPSKIVYQLRRWGIEIPIEFLSGTRADFILYFNFLSYPSLYKTPSAPVIHDVAYLDIPETVSSKNRSDLTRFVPKAIKRSRFVMTVSEFTRQRVHAQYHVPADKILVTPIPSEEPRPLTEATRQKLIKRCGLAKPYILFVGTVEPRKNITGLIAAYKLLPEKIRQQYSLAVVGRLGWDCQAEENAFKEAKDSGYDVKHLGYVDEDTRAALFMNCSLFVTASNYEGFGMPVTEAMAHGAPVAVSDIPVFREVAGDKALYFDQHSPQKIADALENILKDSEVRSKLIQVSKERTAAFRWDIVASKIHDAIIEHLRRN